MKLFRELYLAFYSSSFYQDVASNGRGLGLLYLFLALLIYNVCGGFDWYLSSSKFLSSSKSMGIINQMPNFRLEDGRLSIDKPSPQIVFVPETKKKLIVIDTTHKFKSCADAESSFLITDSAIYIKDKNVPLITYEAMSTLFTNMKRNISGTPQEILMFLQQWLPWVALLYYSWLFLCGMIAILCLNLLLAWIFGIFGSKHSFAARMRLLNTSRIPPTLISSALSLMPFLGQTRFLVEGILVLLYMELAFRWCRNIQKAT